MNKLANILIVEDDSTIRTILQMMLRNAGFTHVKSAARGDEGLEAIRRDRPQLVLLDLMLPGLDGLSLCSRVRADPELADVRIHAVLRRNDPMAARRVASPVDWIARISSQRALRSAKTLGTVFLLKKKDR